MRDFDEFERLLPISQPTLYDSWALLLATEMGQLDMIKRLVPVSDLPNCLECVLVAAAEGHVECLEYLVQYIENDRIGHRALVRAVIKNQDECLSVLLPFVDATLNDSEALFHSITGLNSSCFELLLPHSDPKAYHSRPLRAAARQGKTDFVELLIPLSDPKACDSEALRLAALRGFQQTVKALLPFSDAKANNSEALVAALDFDDDQLAEMLYDVSDLNVALNQLKERHPSGAWPELEERLAAQQQKAILNEVVGLDNGSKRTRKM